MEVCSPLLIKIIKLLIKIITDGNFVRLWEKYSICFGQENGFFVINHLYASLFLLAAYNHGSTAKQAIREDGIYNLLKPIASYMDGSSSLNPLSPFFLFFLSCFAGFRITRLLLFNLLREKQ